jgi:chemotaxis protein MotB
MKRFLFLALIPAMGCVSASRYSDLKAQVQAQSEKTAELEKRLGQADDTNQDLVQGKSNLEDKNDALESDKRALVAANSEKDNMYGDVINQLQNEVSAGQLKITRYQNMLVVDMADKILFDSGQANIKPNGAAILIEVAKAIAGGDKTIRVAGYTDDVPMIAGSVYASNWELSTARATTVVRFLQDQCKIDPPRLIASGRGAYAPVAPNDTPENRQKNRRIEITLLDKSLIDAVELKNKPTL